MSVEFLKYQTEMLKLLLTHRLYSVNCLCSGLICFQFYSLSKLVVYKIPYRRARAWSSGL